MKGMSRPGKTDDWQIRLSSTRNFGRKLAMVLWYLSKQDMSGMEMRRTKSEIF